MPSQKKISFIGVLLAIFIIKETLWLWVIPPWEAPDELAHYSYIESLFYEGRLPELGTTLFSKRVEIIGPVETIGFLQEFSPIGEITNEHSLNSPLNQSFEPSTYQPGTTLNWIAQHPPLYYALLIPFYGLFPHDNVLFSIFLLRCTSIFLAAISLYYIFKTLQKVLPGRPLFHYAVVSAVAFLPTFSYVSALINNDNLVMTLSSILVYQLVSQMDSRRAVKIGVILGLLALTKTTALPLFGVVFIWLIIEYFKAQTADLKKKITKYAIVIFGLPIIIAGWWYIRNYILFQTFLPELKNVVALNPSIISQHPYLTRIFPEVTGKTHNQITVLDFLLKDNFLFEYFKNIWGVFGRFFVQLSSWQYALIFVFVGIGTVGQIFSLPLRNTWLSLQKFVLKKQFLFALIVAIFSILITWKLFGIAKERGFLGAMHGRYFLTALLPFVYFFVRGWDKLFADKWNTLALISVITFFVFIEVSTLLYVVIPTFT